MVAFPFPLAYSVTNQVMELPAALQNISLKKVLILLFLLVSLSVSVYLVGQRTGWFGRAFQRPETGQVDNTPHFVPGEVLVKFRKEAISGKNAPTDAGILDSTSAKPSEVFSADSEVASLLGELQVEKIEKIYKGVGTPDEEIKKLQRRGVGLQGANIEALSKIDLSRTYNLKISGQTTPFQTRETIIRLIKSGLVEYAEPNFIFKTSQANSLVGTIDGPSTGAVNENLKYTAKGSSNRNIKSVAIYWARTTSDVTKGSSWTQVAKTVDCTGYFASGLGECPAEGTFTPKEQGEYYVSVVVVGDVGPCSGNPRYDAVPGWLDCGVNDLIKLTVSQFVGESLPTPTPTSTPSATLAPTPTPLDGSYPNDPYYLDSYPNNVGSRDPNWNPSHDYQWNLKKVNSGGGWSTTTGSQNVVVAVVDTGVDYTHPELGGCTFQQVNSSQCAKVTPGYDFVTCDQHDENGYCIRTSQPDDDPRDDAGHGTFVAGIINALTNNTIGVSSVAPETKVMPVKVLGADGSGSLTEIAQGIKFAADNGAKVINMSFGNYPAITNIPYTFQEPLDYSRNLGIVLVAAAGNADSDVNAGFWPAGYKDVISVAATDQNDQKASYSNYGKIDVAAPGGDLTFNVLSLNSSNPQDSSRYLTEGEFAVGHGFARGAGTSFASPHVAGLAALLLARSPTMSALQIKSLIEYTADDLGTAGFDSQFGWGRINIGTALSSSTNPPIAEIYSPTPNAIVGGIYKITGIATADDFQQYTIEVGVGASPSSWTTNGITLTNGGRSQVTNGQLGTLDTAGYIDQDITIKLNVVAGNGTQKEKRVHILVRRVVPLGPTTRLDSGQPRFVYAPSLATDIQGNIYASWYGGPYSWENQGDQLKIYLSKSSDTGVAFSQPLEVPFGGNLYSYFPSVQTIQNDLFVVFENYNSRPSTANRIPQGRIVLKKSTNQGESFEVERTIEPEGMTVPKQEPWSFMLVQTSSDRERYIYLTWQAGSSMDKDNHVYFSRFDAQSDSFEEIKLLRSGRKINDPSIVGDKNGNVYVVWSEPSSNATCLWGESGCFRIYMVKSNDFGSTFSEPSVIFQTGRSGHQALPRLAINERNEDLYLSWIAPFASDFTYDVWVSRSTDQGATFSPPYNVTMQNWSSFMGALFASSLAFNSRGDMFASWIDFYTAYLVQADSNLQDFFEPTVAHQGSLGDFMSTFQLTSSQTKDVAMVYDFSPYDAGVGRDEQILFIKTDLPSNNITQTFNLSAGYSLVGITVDKGANYKAEDFLQELNQSFTPASENTVVYVIRYDSLKGRYEVHSLGSEANNFSVIPGEAYFVRGTTVGTSTISSEKATIPSVKIAQGWSAGSFPDALVGIQNAEDLLQIMKRQGIDARQILRWSGGRWQVHNVWSSDNNFSITPGEGYFIRNYGSAGTFNLP